MKIDTPQERVAIDVFGHALKKLMTWRHGVRDVVQALRAMEAGEPWECPTCGASVSVLDITRARGPEAGDG